jgi:hypothetical protein
MFIPFKLCLVRVAAAWAALMLAACSSLSVDGARHSDLSSALDQENWAHQTLPTKKNTVFTAQTERSNGGSTLRIVKAEANGSASLLRRKVFVPPEQLSGLAFSWKTAQLLDNADMGVREQEDAVVRVILSFEGDRSRFSAKNRMLSELSLALTGEELPYATLMYVWCNKRQAGQIITNPRTDRIRKIVVESGPKNLGKWLDYERNIRADFLAAFGEEPGALTGIAIMTDTDNTQSRATAWYGPVRLTSALARPAAP